MDINVQQNTTVYTTHPGFLECCKDSGNGVVLHLLKVGKVSGLIINQNYYVMHAG